MRLNGKEHYELMQQFEKEFYYKRLDREAAEWWPKGRVYQSGETNALFLAFRLGVAYGIAVTRE